MNYEIVKRKALQENDCWCDAMALATGISYEKMMDLFHNFKESDGGLRNGYVDSYLQSKGFLQSTFQSVDARWSVDEIMQMYNTMDNYVVIRVESGFKDENGVALDLYEYLKRYNIGKSMLEIALEANCPYFIKKRYDQAANIDFIEIGDLNCGYATAREIRNALNDFEKSGKFIVAYNGGEVITQKEYYLSSAANEESALQPQSVTSEFL